MRNVLKVFLSRAKSEWLFVIDDAAYVRTSMFVEWLTGFFKKQWRPRAIGFCYEIRDYFKLVMTGTGVLIARSLVEEIVRLEETWDVMCRCELRGEEALGHVLMEVQAGAGSNIASLARPFANESDYEALRRKEFGGLPKCAVPRTKSRACSSDPTRMADLIVWAGAGESISEDEFLSQAEEMIEGVPKNIGISWTKTHPWLCILPEDFTPVQSAGHW
jgi:hypothetical protein